jgi:hypothetical protein
MGCYNPSPLKEISSRDLWRMEHKKWWTMHWPCVKKGIETVERRWTHRSSMSLFPLCLGDIAPCRIRLYSMTLLVLRFITPSSSSNSIGYSEWKRTFSSSNVKDDMSHQGKNFQTELILGAIGDDIILDGRIGWIHEVVGKVILTWRRDGQQYLSTRSTLMI